jgi:hypothetical protein
VPLLLRVSEEQEESGWMSKGEIEKNIIHIIMTNLSLDNQGNHFLGKQ